MLPIRQLLSIFLIFSVLGFPLIFGLYYSFLPAFGYAPYLNKNYFTFNYFFSILNQKKTFLSLILSFWTGFFSALSSWLLIFLFGAVFYQTKIWQTFKKYISIFLAYPHLAFGVGLTLLFSPSSIFSHLLGLTFDWQKTPNWIGIPDPYGFSLYIGLILREVPFLIFLMIGILNRGSYKMYYVNSILFGYSRFKTWQNIIWPQISKKLYIPLIIVMIYGLSCIDLSLVLGPNLPPTFSILIFELMKDPNLDNKLLGSVGIILLLLLIIVSISLFFSLETIYNYLIKKTQINGKRSYKPIFEKIISYFMKFFYVNLYVLFFLVIFVNLVWSFIKNWQYPSFFPQWTLKYWLSISWSNVFIETFLLGLFSSLIALFLSCSIFELLKTTSKKIKNRIVSFFLIPFFVPDISLVFGIYILFISLNLNSSYFGILWSHLIFVFPYIYLTLQSAYGNFEERYWQTSLLLRKSKIETFFKIKLPILILPICFSLAIGFSVSVSQYLTTVFIGEGRFSTLTTEALIFASGGNRRVLGIYVTLQSFITFLVFALSFVPYYLQMKKFKN